MDSDEKYYLIEAKWKRKLFIWLHIILIVVPWAITGTTENVIATLVHLILLILQLC